MSSSAEALSLFNRSVLLRAIAFEAVVQCEDTLEKLKAVLPSAVPEAEITLERAAHQLKVADDLVTLSRKQLSACETKGEYHE